MKAKPLLVLFSFVALIYFWQGGLAATPARVPVVGSTLAARSLEMTDTEVSGALLGEEEIIIADTVLSSEPTEKEIEGFLVEEQIDDLERPERSKIIASLIKDGVKKPLNIVGKLDLPPSGSKIKLRAEEKSDRFAVLADDADLQVIDPPPLVSAVEQKHLLILAFNFLDSPDPPFTVEDLSERFNGRVKDYYLEQSYGQMTVSADVYGVFTLPHNGLIGGNCVSPSPTPPVGGGYSELGQVIVDNGINMADYDGLMVAVYHPCQLIGVSTVGNGVLLIGSDIYTLPISFVGIASSDTVNAPYFDQPFPWTRLDYLMVHEFGHGLGLRHSEGLDCGTEIFHPSGSGCFINEYGNSFDAMGRTRFSAHFGAFLKERLGWFLPTDYLTINQSGIYTINPLEASTSIKKAAKIKLLDGSEPFFIEYRQPIGFDEKLGVAGEWNSNTHGLLISHAVVNPNNPTNFRARLLDFSQTVGSSWEDDVVESSLNGNQLFTVPEYGLQIGPILSANSSAISFRVRVESTECTRVDPGNQIIISPAFHAGATTHLTARMDNRDSVACGESVLGLSASLPAGWTFVADAPAGIGLDPGAQEVSGLSITVPLGTPAGLYPVGIIVQNHSSGLTATRNLTINLGSPIQVNFLLPNTTTASATVTVNGSGFSPNGLNFVSLTKGTLTAIVGAIQADSPTSLSFSVPSTGFDSSCGCQQPLTPGLYQLTVSTLAGTSNSLPLTLN